MGTTEPASGEKFNGQMRQITNYLASVIRIRFSGVK